MYVIDIIDLDMELILIVKIVDINEELNEGTIENNIIDDMRIGYGSLIYKMW